MKRAVIILIHTGYWCMYLLLLFVMYLLLAASQEQLIQDFSQGLRMWFRAMAPLAIVPGLLGFYAGYSWLYPAYIAKRRIGFFFLWAILSAFVASIVGIGCMQLMYISKEVRALEWDAYSIMGIIMSLMAAINLVIGVVIRGFINSYQDILVKEELTRHNTKWNWLW